MVHKIKLSTQLKQSSRLYRYYFKKNAQYCQPVSVFECFVEASVVRVPVDEMYFGTVRLAIDDMLGSDLVILSPMAVVLSQLILMR